MEEFACVLRVKLTSYCDLCMIAFDFDDVIYDCDRLIREKFRELYNISIPSNRKEYYIEVNGISNKEISNMVDEILKKYYMNGVAMPKAIQSLKYIYRATNKPILIVTARKEEQLNAANKWLKTQFNNDVKFEIRSSHNTGLKYDYLDEDTKYFVEDHPKYIDELVKHLDYVFVYDHLWNRDIPNYNGKIARINNLDAVYSYVTYKKYFV